MPLQATSGAASYDAFGGGVAAVPQYIEDVFSTYLYTGNGSTQTITNGIDLAGKGGLVWAKSRSSGTYGHQFYDTSRGVGNVLSSNNTNAQSNLGSTGLSVFNSNGFDIGGNVGLNQSSGSMTSWTFRKQPKFFDVVTYTGDGTATRNISHSLGSVPGCIIIKRTDSTGDWLVRHRSLYDWGMYLNLNLTSAEAASTYGVEPTQTTFNVGFNISPRGYNDSGATYVAYLFAHDAGGFGLTGTDNVISCGSFTTNGSGEATVNLGYEPQWVLWKQSNAATDWYVVDNMRGWNMSRYDDVALRPNLSNADYAGGYGNPTATGFFIEDQNASAPHIYIAIRRGPMKVPTSGTSVFVPNTYTGSGSSQSVTTNFPVDLNITKRRTAVSPIQVTDRLRGSSTTYYNYLRTNATDAETTGSTYGFGLDNNTAYVDNLFSTFNSGSDIIGWNWRRAPSFFDEVCYTGTGSATTVTHNLGVAPELIIAKSRSGAFNWTVYSSTLGNSYPLFLNATSNGTTNYGSLMWGSTAPTATQFPVGTYTGTNSNGQTYVAYLFATCAGVSKVGSYTGNGSNQTINCGFTGGARFVMIKATSTTGDWMVADSARGIVSGNDPYLELNNTNAEVTGEDWLDTDSTGFVVNEVSGSNANTNGVTYIYLAIA